MPISSNVNHDYTNKIIDVIGVDASTPYDILNLYSFSKEEFKLAPNAEDDFAWDAPTPFDLTLKAGWYLRRHSIPRINGGTITANYGTDEIEKIELVAGGYVNVIETDIGKTVTDDAAGIGELVDFDNNRRVWWVRTNGTPTTVAASSVMAITTGTGAGTSVGSASVDVTTDQWAGIKTVGDLVTTGPKPLMYVYTGSLATGDNNGNARRVESKTNDVGHFQDDFDEELVGSGRGALNTMVNIIDAGTTLGNTAGRIHVYGRQGLDTFSDFEFKVDDGGLISIPIGNSNDTEDTIGDYCFAYDGGTAGDFTVGEEITEDSAVPKWKAEVVLDIEAGTTTTVGILVVRGLTAAPTDNDTFTGGTSTETGVVRGTAGGQYFAYDAGSDEIIETDYGVTLTSGGATGWTGVLRGNFTKAEGAGGVTGYAVVETRHDVKQFGTDYVLLGDNETITGTGVNIISDTATASSRLCSDLDDVRIKSAYQRLTGITAGDAARGDNITQAVSGAKGTIVEVVSGTEIHVSNNNGIDFDSTNTISDDDGGTLSGTPTTVPRDETFTFEHPLQTTGANYVIMIEGAGRANSEIYAYIKFFQQARSTSAFHGSVDQATELYLLKQELGAGTLISQLIQGEEYFRAFTDEDTPANSFTGQDQKSRLCVKNGSTLVTGQGVAVINVASADANNIVTTDTTGVQRIPFVSATYNITNCEIGAHLHLALDNGSGQEDIAQFNVAAAGNTAGDADLVIDETIPNDTPQSAPNLIVKVVETNGTQTENRELRYRCSSYTGSTFSFVTGAGTGTVTTPDVNGKTLTDSAADFGGADAVEVGDVVRNSTTGDFAWVKEIVSTTVLTTTKLTGAGDNEWGSTDGYDINVLAYTHDGTETCYTPYMDRIIDTATEQQTVTFVSNRNIVLVHRDENFRDVTTLGTFTTSGFNFRIGAEADDKYTPT